MVYIPECKQQLRTMKWYTHIRDIAHFKVLLLPESRAIINDLDMILHGLMLQIFYTTVRVKLGNREINITCKIVCGLYWVEANLCRFFFIVYLYMFFRWRPSYQEGRVRIPLICLTPPHLCACPKPGLKFPTSYVVCVRWITIKGSFCWYC